MASVFIREGMFPSLVPMFIVVITLNFVISLGSTASLYSPDDPLWELDSSNFQRIILGKNNAWIIEFYNSWCGHCIRFVPTWRSFSNDIKTWKSIIDVAAVNCAESENVKLCRDYDIKGYPAIKLFWTNVNETDIGEALSGHRDVPMMEQTVINFLENNWNDAPLSWPNLQPIVVSDLRNFWDNLSHTVDSVFLFVELPDSFVGRKVILDMSAQKHLTIRRVLSSNLPFLDNLELDLKNSSFPLLIRIRRTGEKDIIYRSPKNANSTVIRDAVFELLVGYSRNELQVTLSKKMNDMEKSTKNAVYMTDLENALHYSLKQEIGMHKDISGPRLLALKSYILALKAYFPGKPPLMAFLSKLNNWVSHRKDNVSGEDFLTALTDLQGEKEVLPQMREWIGCKGSDPKYRGYPCSLWTLFHSLTVQAFDMYEGTHGYVKEDTIRVLLAIWNYVKYFFTCEECSHHFQTMYENEEKEISSPRDVVLWLWNAHNKVNKRLSGDVTEDPQHPKIQFPSMDACPRCRITTKESDEIKWDRALVLRYLQHFYGKNHILEDDQHPRTTRKNQNSFSAHENTQSEDSMMVITFENVSFLEKWNFQWFTSTDVSLCVSLYFVSALLLVVIYILFRQRRKRRKIQFRKFINLYP